jgi:hypothetical protein
MLTSIEGSRSVLPSSEGYQCRLALSQTMHEESVEQSLSPDETIGIIEQTSTLTAAGDTEVDAALARWLVLVTLKRLVRRASYLDEEGRLERTLTLRSLQFPQPRRDFECCLRLRIVFVVPAAWISGLVTAGIADAL